MGKYALLIALAGLLGMSYLTQQSLSTSQDTSADLSERQRTVIARQIARSAFNEGVSEANRGVGTRLLSKDREDVAYEGGEFDLAYSNVGTEIRNNINWKYVDLSAEGRFPREGDQAKYRINATARQAISEDVNAITAGESVTFDPKGPGCAKCINGNDDAGGKSRAGVTLPPDGDTQAVCDAFKNGDSNNGSNGKKGPPIIGAGEDCSVKERSDDREGKVDWLMGAIKERILDSKSSSMVEIYDGGSINNNTSPSNPRILYIAEGEVKLSKDWHGLVFVSGSDDEDSELIDVDIIGDEAGQLTLNGNTSVNGSVLMGKEAKFRLNGGGKGSGKSSNIQYNTNNLLGLVEVLPMLGEPIEITDRCGKVVGENEEGCE